MSPEASVALSVVYHFWFWYISRHPLKPYPVEVRESCLDMRANMHKRWIYGIPKHGSYVNVSRLFLKYSLATT